MMLIGMFSYAACLNGFVFLHVSLGKPFACSFGLNYTVFLFLVVGDFNFKEINWKTNMSAVSENHISTKFFECCRDSYFYQHVLAPTRERIANEPSTLDLIFTHRRRKRGGQGGPGPPNNLKGGANIPFRPPPPILHPHFPSISM